MSKLQEVIFQINLTEDRRIDLSDKIRAAIHLKSAVLEKLKKDLSEVQELQLQYINEYNTLIQK